MNHWYADTVIYSLHVESFRDGNGDGVGDLLGVIESLDYLAALGVGCLWLQPIFPSPLRDNGYDVSDYLSVDPRYGDLADFVALVDHADKHNIRILLDMPLNHTSVQHPWFQAARRDTRSRYRDYYYWREDEPAVKADHLIFEGEQESNWTFDESAGAWYYHTFYPHQADLNYTNEQVEAELERILRFWLRLGVAGFRLDAVPHMLRSKSEDGFGRDPHDVLRRIRRVSEGVRDDVVLLGEVDAEPASYAGYFGREDQLNVLLNFYLSNYLFHALATGRSRQLGEALEVLPTAKPLDFYGNFLRNHDELDLERLSDDERREVFEVFAPEEHMQAFGRGIRRRLAPMLNGDRRRMELAYSLLLSMPGIPVLRYGDEIGMGEDLSLPGRAAVRTAMQWTAGPGAGFSSAPPERWAVPLISEGPFGCHGVNVADARRDPGSFLNWLARSLRVRRELTEFGRGQPEVLVGGDDGLFIHRCHWNQGQALAVHELSGKRQRFELPLPGDELAEAVELFADRYYPSSLATEELELEPFGYRWFRMGRRHSR